MRKRSAESAGGNGFNNNFPSTFIEAGREVVRLPDAFATKVSCDVLKYLSMKEFQTYFIGNQDATSFHALYCKPLGFSVSVKADVAEDGAHTVDFFLNDCTRRNPLIRTGEQTWVLICNGDEVGKVAPLLSLQEEMKVRGMAGGAFKALRCAFRKKAKAELHSLRLQFGRPMFGYWAGKPVLAGAITSKECRVFKEGSIKNTRCSELAILTEKFFL